MSEKTKVTLTVSGCETELPVLDATLGPNVVDIRSLTKSTGLFAFDPGFMSTASCESKITYIDGDEGCCITVVIPSNSLPKNPIIWKSATC